MCRVLNVSRSGYYAWRKRPESRRRRDNRRLKARIIRIFKDSHQTYGSPRIHAELRDQGVFCSKKRVARIMRKSNIIARTKKKFKVTTDSGHHLPVAANVLNQDFEAAGPDQIWMADITYIPTRQGWLYLAVVMDLFSRMIIGWSMDNRLTQPLVINALIMALKRRPQAHGVLHHSDRGSQYAAEQYQQILKSKNMLCSMSRKGNCYDNAVIESFFRSLKSDWVHHHDYQTRAQAKASIFEYIEIFYNRKRRHSALNYLSPADYENGAMAA